MLPRSSVVEVGVGLGELGPFGQFVDPRFDWALRARRPLLLDEVSLSSWDHLDCFPSHFRPFSPIIDSDIFLTFWDI